jgi:hypothetical protein
MNGTLRVDNLIVWNYKLKKYYKCFASKHFSGHCAPCLVPGEYKVKRRERKVHLSSSSR